MSDTAIGAFEKAQDKTRAHFTVEHVVRSKAAFGQGTKAVGFFSYEERMPGIVDALKNRNLRMLPIPSYDQPQEPRAYAPLYTTLEIGGDVLLNVVSNATFDGKTFSIDTAITINAADARVFAPALLAWQRTFTAPLDEQDLLRFADLLPEMTTVVMDGGARISARQSFPADREKRFPALFVASYPITVATPSRSYCVGISSYAPLPASVGGGYCNLKAKVLLR